MQAPQRIFLALIALAAFCTSAFAGPSPVGTWKGHIVLDVAKLPKAPNPQAQKMMDEQIAKAKAAVIKLTFKANKTFTATSTGMPGSDNSDNGTWTQTGNTVTIKSTKPSKNPQVPTKPTQNLTLSSDGKTMTLSAGKMATVVFHH